MERKGLVTHYATEDEARQRWCPLARIPGYSIDQTGIAALNRYGNGEPLPPAAECVGSRCMFWRWHDPAARRNVIMHRGARPPDDHGDWCETSWECDRTLAEVQEEERLNAADGMSQERITENQRRYTWHRRLEDLPPRGYCGSAGP